MWLWRDITTDSTREAAQQKMDDRRSLFVANLLVERTSESEVRSIFEKYGSVTDVKLKGSFGFVTFASHDAAQNAKEREKGRLIGGRPIDIEWSKSDKPTGGPKRHDRERDDRGPYSRPRGRDDYSRDKYRDDRRDRDRDTYRDTHRVRDDRRRDEPRRVFADKILCHIYYYGMFVLQYSFLL